MMRFAWVTMASAVLLAGCGGGLSSPDFQGDLVGFDIAYPNSTTPNTPARAAPGTTFQFSAVGLYSLPPGTAASATTRSCPSASDASRVCQVGEIQNVTWSVDPSGTVNGQPLATISSDGLATAMRRGYAQVRARVSGFPDSTEQLIVNGPVVQGISVTVVNAKYSTTFPATPTPSVPTGRSFALTGTASCERGFTGGEATGDGPVAASPSNCVNGANASYQFRWTLGDTTEVTAAEFSPASGVGKSILVKTKRFGPFEVLSRFTNEEGQEIQRSVPLDAATRVLDDILVSSDPAQAQPVPVVIGTKTRFIARGLFSDGNIDQIKSTDLKTGLEWSADTQAVGRITIESATGPSPNAAVLVSGSTEGITGLTAKGTNSEPNVPNKPDGLELEDRVSVNVRDFGLIGLVDICPFDSVGTACEQNQQIPVGTTRKFKARGKFEDNPNLTRDIDPAFIPLVWSKTVTAASGDVTVVSSGTPAVTTGEFTGVRQGAVTLNVALADGVEPMAAPRQVSAGATVVEALCVDQLLASNGTTATGSSARVTNLGNVIDANPDTAGRIVVTQGGVVPAAGSENAVFRRDGITVTPSPTGTNVGFLVSYPATFNPESLITVQTVDAQGTSIEGNDADNGQLKVTAADTGVTRTPAGGTPSRLFAVKAKATKPFSGLRIRVQAPSDATPPSDPTQFLAYLQALLAGDNFEVDVWAACANFGN